MTQWDDQTRRMPAADQPGYRDPNAPGYRDPNAPGYRDPNAPAYRDPNAPGAFGQQTYGQNQYGAPANPFGAAGDRAFGIASLVTSLIGGIVVLVAFTAVDWLDGGISFSDLHDAAGRNSNPFSGFGEAYFSWLAWAFLILGVVTAVLASFPSPALRAFRAIGVVVGIAAAGLTFLAVKLNGESYGTVLGHSQVGFWLTPIGFILIAVGAGIGPRRV